MNSINNYETELKFKVDDFAKFRAELKRQGATFKGITQEQNFCFDDKERSLKRNDNLLRLRTVGDKTLLTFKGAKEKDGDLKKREELELEISNFELMKSVLVRLGFTVYRVYEKKREIYLLEGVEVVLDLIPFIGTHVELEGSSEGILKVMKLLSLNKKDACDYTYATEAEEWFKKGYSLTFEEEARYHG